MAQTPPQGREPYRALLEALPAAVTVHTMVGEYVYVSPQFEVLTGYATDEVLGRSAYDLVHPEDVDHVWTAHANLVDESHPAEMQFRFRLADGSYRWVASSCQVTGRQEGRPEVVCLTRMMGQEERADSPAEEQRRSLQDLRTLAAERQAFLTAISHRARNPMTAILGFAHLLRDRVDLLTADQQHRCVDRLLVNAERMAQLIEQVTEAESLRSRTVGPGRRPVELDKLVDEVVDGLASPSSPIEVEADAEATLVFVDANRARLLIRALVLNALEHSPPATPVWIAVRRETQGTVLSVADAGPGVAEELKDHVFEPFFRGLADDPDPGVGLGLYLVSEIASLHGGRAWVEDRDGGGSVFRVLLPGEPAAGGVPEPAASLLWPDGRRSAPRAD